MNEERAIFQKGTKNSLFMKFLLTIVIFLLIVNAEHKKREEDDLFLKKFENIQDQTPKTIKEIILYPNAKDGTYVYDFCYSFPKIPTEIHHISLNLTFPKTPNEVDLSYSNELSIDYYGEKNFETTLVVLLHDGKTPVNNWSWKYFRNGRFEGRILSQGLLTSATLNVSGRDFVSVFNFDKCVKKPTENFNEYVVILDELEDLSKAISLQSSEIYDSTALLSSDLFYSSISFASSLLLSSVGENSQNALENSAEPFQEADVMASYSDSSSSSSDDNFGSGNAKYFFVYIFLTTFTFFSCLFIILITCWKSNDIEDERRRVLTLNEEFCGPVIVGSDVVVYEDINANNSNNNVNNINNNANLNHQPISRMQLATYPPLPSNFTFRTPSAPNIIPRNNNNNNDINDMNINLLITSNHSIIPEFTTNNNINSGLENSGISARNFALSPTYLLAPFRVLFRNGARGFLSMLFRGSSN